eukprot:CAMPEP_0178864848 /NCGR_PEP_ID=MMETSP0747-20121128/4105_1 /TAXON_ID=913974 /ORGANISM="Nitzschia punctata, Strain CCMP561" /LENGTH=758 /DNA_ID=CAMNT_0020531615 /DNA_START=19 /DNA_END=2292 /DNA_ORIENTATION=-
MAYKKRDPTWTTTSAPPRRQSFHRGIMIHTSTLLAMILLLLGVTASNSLPFPKNIDSVGTFLRRKDSNHNLLQIRDGGNQRRSGPTKNTAVATVTNIPRGGESASGVSIEILTVIFSVSLCSTFVVMILNSPSVLQSMGMPPPNETSSSGESAKARTNKLLSSATYQSYYGRSQLLCSRIGDQAMAGALVLLSNSGIDDAEFRRKIFLLFMLIKLWPTLLSGFTLVGLRRDPWNFPAMYHFTEMCAFISLVSSVDLLSLDPDILQPLRVISFVATMIGYTIFSAPNLVGCNQANERFLKQVGHDGSKGNIVHDKIDVERLNTVSNNLLSIYGGYTAVAAATVYLLASGVHVGEVVGYMALACIPVMETVIQHTKTKEGTLFGIDSGLWSMVVGVGMVSIAAGCLSSSSAVTSPTGMPSVMNIARGGAVAVPHNEFQNELTETSIVHSLELPLSPYNRMPLAQQVISPMKCQRTLHLVEIILPVVGIAPYCFSTSQSAMTPSFNNVTHLMPTVMDISRGGSMSHSPEDFGQRERRLLFNFFRFIALEDLVLSWLAKKPVLNGLKAFCMQVQKTSREPTTTITQYCCDALYESACKSFDLIIFCTLGMAIALYFPFIRSCWSVLCVHLGLDNRLKTEMALRRNLGKAVFWVSLGLMVSSLRFLMIKCWSLKKKGMQAINLFKKYDLTVKEEEELKRLITIAARFMFIAHAHAAVLGSMGLLMICGVSTGRVAAITSLGYIPVAVQWVPFLCNLMNVASVW